MLGSLFGQIGQQKSETSVAGNENCPKICQVIPKNLFRPQLLFRDLRSERIGNSRRDMNQSHPKNFLSVMKKSVVTGWRGLKQKHWRN